MVWMNELLEEDFTDKESIYEFGFLNAMKNWDS